MVTRITSFCGSVAVTCSVRLVGTMELNPFVGVTQAMVGGWFVPAWMVTVGVEVESPKLS